MMHDDRITFALLLCRIYLRGLSGLVVLAITAINCYDAFAICRSDRDQMESRLKRFLR